MSRNLAIAFTPVFFSNSPFWQLVILLFIVLILRRRPWPLAIDPLLDLLFLLPPDSTLVLSRISARSALKSWKACLISCLMLSVTKRSPKAATYIDKLACFSTTYRLLIVVPDVLMWVFFRLLFLASVMANKVDLK